MNYGYHSLWHSKIRTCLAVLHWAPSLAEAISANPTGPTQLEFPNAVVGFSIQGPSRLTDNTFAYSDLFSWTRGKHTFKFGGSFSAYQDNQVFDFEVNGVFQFAGQDGNGNTLAAGDPFANFILGVPTAYFQ